MRIVVAGGTGTVGRHVVEVGRGRGHDVVGISRATGHDLARGREGLDAALEGADAVVDVTNVVTLSTRTSVGFGTRVTRRLLAAEDRVGVGHHVVLSVVGIDGIDTGYYAGKLAQERMVATAPVPWTIQRAAQLHELAEQALGFARLGPVSVVPRMLSRPVAARTVAERLVDHVENGPAGRAVDLVGPREEVVADLARRLVRARRARRRVVEITLPGAYGRGLASGALRGDEAADVDGPDFASWLAGVRGEEPHGR